MSSTKLINKFLIEVNKESYDFIIKDSFDDFEYIDNLIKYYISKGMKLTKTLDRILFQEAEYLYIYILLIKNGYTFKNNVAVAFFFLDLAKKLSSFGSDYDPREIQCKLILKSKEVQKYFKLGEIIITDKDMDDYIKLGKNKESVEQVLFFLIDWNYKDTQTIIWPKIVFKFNKYLESEEKKRKEIEEYKKNF